MSKHDTPNQESIDYEDEWTSVLTVRKRPGGPYEVTQDGEDPVGVGPHPTVAAADYAEQLAAEFQEGSN